MMMKWISYTCDVGAKGVIFLEIRSITSKICHVANNHGSKLYKTRETNSSFFFLSMNLKYKRPDNLNNWFVSHITPTSQKKVINIILKFTDTVTFLCTLFVETDTKPKKKSLWINVYKVLVILDIILYVKLFDY